MKKTIILPIFLIFLMLLPLATAFTIEEGTCIELSASNTRYILGTNFSFTELKVKNNAPYFNGNIFCIEPDSGTANVTVYSLNSMSFTVNATANVVFTLGGFIPRVRYTVNVDNWKWDTVIVNSSGILQFQYDSWSEHDFDILLFASTTTNRIVGIFPVLIAIALLFTFVGLLFTGTLTVENLIYLVVVAIIVVVTIQIII